MIAMIASAVPSTVDGGESARADSPLASAAAIGGPLCWWVEVRGAQT